MILSFAGQIILFNGEKANAAKEPEAPQKPGNLSSKARTGKAKSSQRALDKAHNDAVLAGTSGAPQDLALQLALQEPKVRLQTSKLWRDRQVSGGQTMCMEAANALAGQGKSS